MILILGSLHLVHSLSTANAARLQLVAANEINATKMRFSRSEIGVHIRSFSIAHTHTHTNASTHVAKTHTHTNGYT